jgi:hypothetical protein
MIKAILATISGVALAATSAHAVLIAFDSFALGAAGQADGSYEVDSLRDLSNPSATLGTTGYLGSWANSTGAHYVTTGGLSHALTTGTVSEGRLVAFNSTGAAGRTQLRSLNYTPTDGTYFFSALFQKTAITTDQDMVAGVTAGSISPSNGAYTLGSDFMMGIVDGGFTVTTAGADTELITAASFTLNETYFGLMAINYSTSGADSATVSVYNGTSALVAEQTFTGLNLTLTHFAVATNNYGPDVSTDELRFGTALSDVSIVPEPSSAVLLGLGSLLVCLCRRRR